MASTSTGADKPLPTAPPVRQLSGKELARLSVESRAHLRLFIKHALAEENVEGAPSWAKGLELALRELCDAMVRGAWLAGLKEARKAEQNRRWLEEKEERETRQRGGYTVTKESEKWKDKAANLDICEGRSQTPDVGERSEDERRRLALAQISKAISATKTPSPGTRPSHLLLTLSPRNAILSPQNNGHDTNTPNKMCLFTADKYMLPSVDDWKHGTNGIILYGLDEWDVDRIQIASGKPIKLVGGTFSFSGLSSTEQLHSLTKVLRLSLFVCLSLILEQHILNDSHVHLHFPAEVAAIPLNHSLSTPDVVPARQGIKRTSKTAGSGLWSMFARKAETLLNRAAGVPNSATIARTKSLEVSDSSPPPRSRSIEILSPANSIRRARRLSFSLSSSSKVSNEGEAVKQGDNLSCFTTAVNRIISSASFLSTSAGITFCPPRILNELADKEKHNPNRKLYGYEKVQLHSLLGWEGRESRGRGMGGLAGFFRHQGISFLYSEYVPRLGFRQETDSQTSATPSTTSQTSYREDKELSLPGLQPIAGSSSTERTDQSKLVPCERGRWVTYRYFKRNPDRSRSRKYADHSLGDFIASLACRGHTDGDERCERPGCDAHPKDHRMFWIHGGIRVSAETIIDDSKDSVDGSALGEERIESWESCAVCQKETERRRISDGAYLYSFAKFLELLIYSPSLCTLSPRLCSHTTPPPFPWPPHDSPPSTRFNIIRHFLYVGSHNPARHKIVFRTAQSPALFEVRIPQLQLLRGRAFETRPSTKSPEHKADSSQRKGSQDLNEEKRELRKEIQAWWQSISDHMDTLDQRFSDNEIARKSLPRLPSNDDAFDEGDMPTPKPTMTELPALPPSKPPSPQPETHPEASSETTPISSRTATNTEERLRDASETTTIGADGKDPSQLLFELRECFQRSEQFLYSQLSRTPASTLNNVRRSFKTVSRGAIKRLSAWEQKHLPERKGKKKGKEVDYVETAEPDWWKADCHAVPGGNVVVKEQEWASIIAFTLSSLDYQRELANMFSKPVNSERTTPSMSQEATSSAGSRSSTSTAATTSQEPTPSPLDPDIDNGVWYEPEAHSATICRQNNPKDPSGLLSLRDVLRQRRSVDANGSLFSTGSIFSGAGFSPSRFVSTMTGTPVPRVVSNGTPPSAWAQPAVQVSMQAAGGKVSGLPESRGESAEKILQDMEANTENSSYGSSFFSQWKFGGPSSPNSNRVHRPPSLISVESDSTEASILSPTAESRNAGRFLKRPEFADFTCSTTPTESATNSNESSVASLLQREQRDSTSTENTKESTINQSTHSQTPTVTTLTSTLASTVTNAVKYFLNQDEDRRAASPAHHHKLLALDSQAIEDRPHIKYDWTVGKRLKFSCTAYYAKHFEYLRRRCGVEDAFPISLKKSTKWAADGGKSRSNFWKTTDDRFVIKTLVNAWNVADLQVLLELAPSYFRYMESSASRPSVIAKLLGFYTIEIKNLETGNVQAKADLLVMENLFYQQKVSKTFDLKGIQGRKVKASGNSSDRKTLFDGEWIEDQQKALILVYPDSKLVLYEAIKADADFLCKNNIMDYSLLLGVDEERKQISCGLVDTIGSYTFAKTLEYKAKQNLNSGREVTVIPPNEYHDRFVSAINNYFLACPDKWSKPIHDLSSDKVDNDLTLPSVL